MMVCLNGRFVTESEACIPVSDRSFLYGDALFETLRVYGGVPFAWKRHLDRMRIGAGLLGIPLPSESVLRTQAQELLKRNGAVNCVLRIHLSRGSGARGYSPGEAGPPRILLTIGAVLLTESHQPRSLTLITARQRVLSGGDWAFCKSANRLLQIMATAEAAQAGADEALMLNERGEVVEAASANFFWLTEDGLCTPPLDSGALAGITRAWVLELAGSVGFAVQEQPLEQNALERVETAFLTSSVQELQWIRTLDGRELDGRRKVESLQRAYRRQVANECGLKAGD